MTAKTPPKPLDGVALDRALRTLAIRLDQNRAPPMGLVVCGGSALLLAGLVTRTTRDVDIVALHRAGRLANPDPLPPDLAQAVRETAEDLALPEDWLNNAPSRGPGGLFQLGLPAGCAERLHRIDRSPLLTLYVIDRFDQIHFKLYAAADQGGRHVGDLLALAPNPEELVVAARWAMTHDVSEGFRDVLRRLLEGIGHGPVADRI